MFWLGLGYPLFAHLAVLTHDRRLEWLALVWLLGIAMSGALIQRRVWAWGALLAGDVVLGAVFILEYGYRRWRFSHHEHSGLLQYLRRLSRTKLKV